MIDARRFSSSLLCLIPASRCEASPRDARVSMGLCASMMLVADGLARRGRPVGVVVLDGGSLVDTSIRTFHELAPAMVWAHGGPVVWCS